MKKIPNPNMVKYKTLSITLIHIIDGEVWNACFSKGKEPLEPHIGFTD